MSDYNNDNSRSLSRSPKKVIRSPEYIRIKVVEEEFNNEMYFSLAMSTEMQKLKKSYAKREDVRLSSLRFIFEGRRIDDEDTPKDLGMVQDDIIEVYQCFQGGPHPENRNFQFSEAKVAGNKMPISPKTSTVTNMSASSSTLEEGEIAVVLPKSNNSDNNIKISSTTTTKTKEKISSYKNSPSSPVKKMDFDEKKQNMAVVVDGEKSKEKKPRYSHNTSGKFFFAK